ncbi:MAG: cytochrome c peroxidase [Polaribacter sp.]|jgi:cytochrome c peroxidase
MFKKKFLFCVFILVLLSCSKESNEEEYVSIPAPLQIPTLFQNLLIPPLIPSNNLQTQEGIFLGKKLFFENGLSADNTQSCATCHDPKTAFTDKRQFSDGIDGVFGNRNTMPLFNLAWNFDENFFWDGRSISLEKQAIEPVINPIEMHNTWKRVVANLQSKPAYPELFYKAFGTRKIDSILVAKALAQFQRTLISANSKFDQYLEGKVQLSASELNGFNVFMNETKGDCFHCHGSDKNPLWTDNKFHNNGLDASFSDIGLAKTTGDPSDTGKFKSPSLRNLAFTAPYMHDGRFSTLEEVINQYSEGLKASPTIDPLMKKVSFGGVKLSTQEKSDLKAFLLSLSDSEFINNHEFQKE